MPEYRRDLLTGRMVIVAEERATRPYQFDIERNDSHGNEQTPRSTCPFCPGNESQTPNEIAAFRPNGSEWTVRVVPNKYPAVVHDATTPWSDLSFHGNGPLSESMNGVGQHEVIVDTPRHILSIAEMTEHEVEVMFQMYCARLHALRAEERYATVMIFKNVGAAAGASLPHSHSQLVAMPFVPESLRFELERALDYRSKKMSPVEIDAPFPCVWCDMLAAELSDGRRIVEETKNFVAFCPYVSRFPAEVAVFPKGHQPFFEDLQHGLCSEVAHLVRRTVRRLEKATPWMKNMFSYNIVLGSGPFRYEKPFVYHAHLSILPSLSRAAGFEWGTGLHINPISPETAAAKLRNTEP